MLHKSSILLIVVLCVGWAIASPLQETNAQRFARGLPPNPPKFARIDTRNKPSAPMVAKSPSVSSLPSVTLTGRLELRNKDGSSLGHVRNWPGGGTISGVNALGPSDDLLVSMKFSQSSPKQFDILATNPAFPKPFYVGAGTFSTATVPMLKAGSRNTVPFTNVESTPPGSHPTIPATRQAYVESAIWSIDQATKKLTAQWINDDGSTPPTVIAYDIRENNIFFVGDISAYNLNNDLPASAVDLFLV